MEERKKMLRLVEFCCYTNGEVRDDCMREFPSN